MCAFAEEPLLPDHVGFVDAEKKKEENEEKKVGFEGLEGLKEVHVPSFEMLDPLTTNRRDVALERHKHPIVHDLC